MKNVTIHKIKHNLATPYKSRVYRDVFSNWDFPNMIESINHQKVPPRRFLKSKNAHAMGKIPFYDKDALGREKIIKNEYFWGTLVTTLLHQMLILQGFQSQS